MPHDDEHLITRVTTAAVAGVMRELGYGGVPEREPLYVPDAEARDRVFRCSRDTYRALTRQPDFPPALLRGSTKMRELAALKAFLAKREVRS